MEPPIIHDLQEVDQIFVPRIFENAIRCRRNKAELFLSLAYLLGVHLDDIPEWAVFLASDLGLINPQEVINMVGTEHQALTEPEIETLKTGKRADFCELRKKRQLPGASEIEFILISDDEDGLQRYCSQPGFDVNTKVKYTIENIGRPTLIGFAALHRSIKCFKFLLLNGADPKIASIAGYNALHLAMYSGEFEIIEILLEYGMSLTGCLYAAVFGQQNQIVRWLVREKHMTCEDSLHHDHMIFSIAMSGNLSALLMFPNLNVNLKNEESYSVLHVASMNGQDAVTLFLIEKGAKINAKTDDFWTPLHYAVEKDHESETLILLKNGANSNAQDIWA